MNVRRPRLPDLNLSGVLAPAPAAPPSAPLIGIRHLAMVDIVECRYISALVRLHLPPGTDSPISRHFAPGSPTIGIVAVVGGRVAGYMLYSCWPAMLGAPGRYQVEDIGVEPYYRRQTVGTRLVAWLRDRLGGDRTRIEAEVHESAMDATCPFLAAQGFAALPWATGRFVEGGRLRMGYDAGDVARTGTGCLRREDAR